MNNTMFTLNFALEDGTHAEPYTFRSEPTLRTVKNAVEEYYVGVYGPGTYIVRDALGYTVFKGTAVAGNITSN